MANDDVPVDFWELSECADENYTDCAPTPEVISSIEGELGYKLPPAYIALAQSRNGGFPRRTNYRTKTRTSWAEDHVAIVGIYSIGREKPCSLCGEYCSRFWMKEWGYPAIGIYFADCPSAGHDMLCLDYRQCGPAGDPSVVHVDQECDYAITFVAGSFAEIIAGLEDDDTF